MGVSLAGSTLLGVGLKKNQKETDIFGWRFLVEGSLSPRGRKGMTQPKLRNCVMYFQPTVNDSNEWVRSDATHDCPLVQTGTRL